MGLIILVLPSCSVRMALWLTQYSDRGWHTEVPIRFASVTHLRELRQVSGVGLGQVLLCRPDSKNIFGFADHLGSLSHVLDFFLFYDFLRM